jgi:hypothetical protein
MPETFSRLPEIPVASPESIGLKFLNELKIASIIVTAGLLAKWRLDGDWSFEVKPHPAENSLETKFSPQHRKKLPQGNLLRAIEAEPLAEEQLDDVVQAEQVVQVVQIEQVEQVAQVMPVAQIEQVEVAEMSATKETAIAEEPLPALIEQKAPKPKDPQEILEIIAGYEAIGVVGVPSVEMPQPRASIIIREIEAMELAEKNPERILEAVADLEILKPAEELMAELAIEDIQLPEMVAEEITLVDMVEPVEFITPSLPVVQEFQHFTMIPNLPESSPLPEVTTFSPQTFSEANMSQALGSLGAIGLSTSTLGQPQLSAQSYGSGYSALPLAV